ncbi:DExH-box ATP-dependent RNA helicase DExH7, chloroplastic-like isoform X3 [Zingiber officinale]|uniref:DExH-box ATP-dependent RNA helicase DExH7, chloroplastic-like isoform X3 n=1 Tax=Zingiber officinale TaxID=94328 RepID=UPI001C4CB600|nr:DExH-box ATP-dependent RNA helicase DExH7, chloroplastic-like isoform X3 [Zingiber officinale]
MAPKKKRGGPTGASKAKSHTADGIPAPKLQISSENERRLRRLLLNNDRPSSSSEVPAVAAPDVASKYQKAKRLRAVYDKLSLEGFSADQIEKALSALGERAVFENALDWLCFNLPGHELPIKFSSGFDTSNLDGTERSVKIISTAREDWVPQQRELEHVPKSSLGIKAKRDELSLDIGKSSQKEWIQQYLEREQELMQTRSQEDDPNFHADSVLQQYHQAWLGAREAKQKGDKTSQKEFGNLINKLKQELSLLGYSNEVLMDQLQDESTTKSVEEITCDSTFSVLTELNVPDNNRVLDQPAEFDTKQEFDSDGDEVYMLKDVDSSTNLQADPINEAEKDIEELELDNLFSEDSSSSSTLYPEILQQKKKNLSEFAYRHNLGSIDDIWMKGDSRKIPKAVLQKLCQKLGWEPPKYAKLSGKEDKFQYSVSILRTARGRGKSRKAGGLISIQFPDNGESSKSVEDAQNKVASFALCQLFPDLPLCHMLLEPYSSFILIWQNGELPTNVEDDEDARRIGFVDSLLNSLRMTPSEAKRMSNSEIFTEGNILQMVTDPPSAVADEKLSVNTGIIGPEQLESIFLKKELENKMTQPKYMKMLEARSSLPISKFKSNILQLLVENDVIVVCGETGCGKTTQVPQYILDDMIRSGLGGCCNIVCTQPRRLAAISVAERVSDERCEPSPGGDGSLVGYQVRLDIARNDKTKLLFCTTGILLRKLSDNKNLSGITHVIVDEVHERSLLADFLLIVLKNLIDKQSDRGGQKLKVVLMSATVDSSLFSRYFGHCPVIIAEGRTHPVSTYFLEDAYEKLNYCLASDSRASGTSMTIARHKLKNKVVDNHRGKRNVVLSSWGDESLLSEDYVNPHYLPDQYTSYSEKTCKNLKHLNEDVIDFDLLEDLICFIDENYPMGAILVFLPGVAEIDLLVDMLTASFQFGGVSSDWILPLHSSLSSLDQKKVFLTPPQNIRKVIIATDIAETSITIDDVIYVVDVGKHKEMRYNAQKKMSSMVEDWISKANAKQRRGRAGRVKAGTCFCLYTRHRYEKLMRSFQVPEMVRMPLTELCLQIKSLSLGDIKAFLLQAIEPPHEDVICSALDVLYKVGALNENEELTPLGSHLAKLPVDVLIGKMMLYGAIFGCLSPILSLAAFLSYKFPFVYPKDEKQNVERAKLLLLSSNLDNKSALDESFRQSDHLLMIIAYNKWARILHQDGARSAQEFCHSFFLNSAVMYMIRDMRVQFGCLLADIRLVDLPKHFQSDARRRERLDSWLADMSQPFNLYANHASLIKSIICAGLYPNVAATKEGIVNSALSNTKLQNVKNQMVLYDGRREVHIHPSSINYSVEHFRYPFFVFLEKVETSKIFLRDTSVISPYSLLLFGGSVVIQHQSTPEKHLVPCGLTRAKHLFLFSDKHVKSLRLTKHLNGASLPRAQGGIPRAHEPLEHVFHCFIILLQCTKL